MLPEEAVRRTLKNVRLVGLIRLASVGKAAWRMAVIALDQLGESLDRGIVITQYGHIFGELNRIACFDAGHPLPDDHSLKAAEAALEFVTGLTKDNTALFLLSGGNSALFEKPLITLEEQTTSTDSCFCCGAGMVEINTIRRWHKFQCHPAKERCLLSGTCTNAIFQAST